MLKYCRSNPNLGSRMKEEDKLFTSLFSKESSVANPSFRVYYADNVPSAVPFVWETQPGTPKHDFFPKNDDNYPPTLRPPPSFYFTPTRDDHKPTKTHSMSRSTHTLFNNLRNIVPPYKKNQLSSSLSSSSSSLSSYSSSAAAPASEKARVVHQRRRLLSIGSAFDEIYDFSASKKRSLQNSMLVCFGIHL